jgi:putative spermidine/putrescine transport system permease protein
MGKPLAIWSWLKGVHVSLWIIKGGLCLVSRFPIMNSPDRCLPLAGSDNTLPVEIWTLLLNGPTPALYAIGTMTTAVSLVVIAASLGTVIF